MGSDLDTFTGQFGITLHRLKLIPDHDKLAPPSINSKIRFFMNGVEIVESSVFQFNVDGNGDYFVDAHPAIASFDPNDSVTFQHDD